MKTFIVCVLGMLSVVSALYSSGDDVVELTAGNFNSKVLDGDEVWMVEFYAPWCGHCKNLAPEWKKAAKALKGIVKVGAVDMDQHQSVGGPYNVRGFPTIKVFGLDKKKPADYNGARSAQAIVDNALSTAKSVAGDRLSGRGGSSGGGSGGGSGGSGGKKSDPDAVIELTDSNFEKMVLESEDMWLVEFYAPWCGHCKNLAPHWEQAATELKGKVKLGALDATVHTVMSNRYGVQGFPTIKMFPAGKKDGEVVEYGGGRTSNDIVAWALDKGSENITPPKIYEVRGFPSIKMFASGKKDGEVAEYDGGRTANDIVTWAVDKLGENVAAPENKQLTSEGVLKKACDDHQLCIIAIMPHILDCQSECRNKYLGTMQRMGEKYKKRMWGWTWAEAGAQPEVEEAFGMGGFGYPTMAALNARKMKFALLMGPFEDNGVNEFLRALAVGRGSTAPLKNARLPPVVESEAWDGKDGELPVEEDIDLSDILLDDLDDVKEEL